MKDQRSKGPGEIDELRRRLEEAEDALRAIREGDVDAIVVTGNGGERVFSLTGAEQLYRRLVETMQEAALSLAPGGRILYANAQFAQMIGRPLELVLGRSVREFVPAEMLTQLDHLLSVRATGHLKGRLVFLTDKHIARPVLASTTRLVQVEGDDIVCMVATDISEVEETNRMLRRRAEQLRRLTSELTLAEHRERQRLATILHDHLQQLLVSAKFRTAWLQRSNDELSRQRGRELEELLDQSLDCSRSLTAELSPPILREEGLKPALDWLARWMREKHGLNVRMTVTDRVPRLEKADLAILLFQAVRELLFNVVKHSKANEAWVRMDCLGETVYGEVRDEGVGFDPVAVQESHDGEGFGLMSIRERLELLGGCFEVHSRPGGGSRFGIVVPLKVPEEVLTTAVPRKAASLVSLTPAVSQPHPKTAAVRVLLVDDHPIAREGLAQMLALEPDLEVVGEAADGQGAVAAANLLRPDLVLMDVSMPGMNGVEATRIICRDMPEVQVIGLSMYGEHERGQDMRDAGAVNYVSKSESPAKLVAAIRACTRRGT